MRPRSASCAALAAALLAPPALAALPHSQAALGDSLTTARRSDGTLADNPAASWSTGTEAAVESHYLRLLRRTGAIEGRSGNYAVSGAKMAATFSQAASALGQGAEYVTILAGTNDACTATAAEMTSVADFTSQVRSTLARLSAGLPAARLFVASIPDWYGHWLRYRDTPDALAAWAATNRCPALLSAGASEAEREAVRQRIEAFNGALASVCAEFAACLYDGGATFALAFAPEQLALSDWFHLSLAGQALLARATWAAGPYARPAPLAGFAAAAGADSVSLSWTVPEGVARVLVLEREGAPPAGPGDGRVVYEGGGAEAGLVLGGRTGGVTYHYAAWTFDVDGAQGDPARTEAVPTSPAPINTVRPAISGTAEEGQALSASTGGWTGSPTSYAYRWRRCDHSGCSAIGGATAQTYTLVAADVGFTLQVVVTAGNEGGSASAESDPTAVVQARPTQTNLARERESSAVGAGGSAETRLTDNPASHSNPDRQPLPAGAVELPGGELSIPVTSVDVPERLLVESVTFRPSLVRSRGPVRAEVLVTDTRGFRVRDALVFLRGVPAGRIEGPLPEQRTDAQGIATFTLRPTALLQLRRGARLTLFVRARKEGERVIAGVSNSRLLSLRIGAPRTIATPVRAPTAVPAAGAARLVVERVRFTPALVRSRAPIEAEVLVTNAQGEPVEGALVFLRGVPARRIEGPLPEARTDGNGIATFTLRPTELLPLRGGARLTLFVRARTEGQRLIGGNSGRRLVSLRLGAPR